MSGPILCRISPHIFLCKIRGNLITKKAEKYISVLLGSLALANARFQIIFILLPYLTGPSWVVSFFTAN
jgi:hypothetical protein